MDECTYFYNVRKLIKYICKISSPVSFKHLESRKKKTKIPKLLTLVHNPDVSIHHLYIQIFVVPNITNIRYYSYNLINKLKDSNCQHISILLIKIF